MSQPAKAQEPSMEEILASIRRIIADDDSAKPAPKPQPMAPLRPASPPPPRVAVAAPEPPPPSPPPRPLPQVMPEPAMTQSDVDAMMRELDTQPNAGPAAQEPDDILELTEQMTAPPPPSMIAPPPASSFKVAELQPDAIFRDSAPPPPPPPVEEPARRSYSPVAERALLSSTATAAVNSAFSTLAHTVLAQNARTLENLVRDMLRPMLKDWLDDNLPGMVERIVRAEIERVSRGRG